MPIINGTSGNDILTGTPDADTINGVSGNDVISGDAGNDLLIGELGDDTIYGGAGDDEMYAGFRYTSAFSDAGSVNRLFGEAGNDIIVGKEGVDFLDGGSGDDFLNASEGDTAFGGDGADLLVDRDTILWRGAALDGGAGNDEIRFGTNSSRVTGGSGADLFNLSLTVNSANFAHQTYGIITDFNQAEGDRILIATFPGFLPNATFRGDLQNPGFTLQAGQTYSSSDYGPGYVQLWTWRDAGTTYLLADLNGDGILGVSDFVLRFSGQIVLSESSFVAGILQSFPGGGEGADNFTGTAAADTYYGFDGNDVVRGEGGNDVLFGNNGADQLFGGLNEDSLNGGAGDDVLWGEDGWDTLTGSSGSDTLYGGAGNDRLIAQGNFAGDQDAVGEVNRLYGEGGDDQIEGSASGLDQMYGGDGNDSISGSGFIDGGAGDDSIRALDIGSTVFGGDGRDIIRGGLRNDTLIGGAGIDELTGGSGDDILVGGIGDSVSGDGGDDLARFDPTALSDGTEFRFFGGSQTDTVDLSAASGPSRIDLNISTTQQLGWLRVTLDSVENVIDGDHGSVLIGNASANVLTGAGGADTLTGGAGADTFRYVATSDSTAAAQDIITDFQTGVDRIDLTGINPTSVSVGRLAGGVSVVFAESPGGAFQAYVNGAVNANDLVFNGTTGAFVIGSVEADTITGSARPDPLLGAGGDDTITGGAGADAIAGGAGRDVFRYVLAGESNQTTGFDNLYDFTSGEDRIDLTLLVPTSISILRTENGSSFIYAETPTGGFLTTAAGRAVQATDIVYGPNGVGGFGIYMVGSGVDDVLVGTGLADPLYGREGDDTITGGGGADAMFGEGGIDTFVYLAASDSTQAASDGIFGFLSGTDKLDLRAVRTGGGDTYGIAYLAGGSFLFVDLGGNGTQDMVIGLAGTTLLAGDILWATGAIGEEPGGKATGPEVLPVDDHDALFGGDLMSDPSPMTGRFMLEPDPNAGRGFYHGQDWYL